MADKTFSLLAQLSLNDDAFKNSLKSVKENTKGLIDGVEGVNGNLNEMRKALAVLNNTSFAGKSQEEINAIKKRVGELKEDMIDLKAQEKAMGMALVEVVPSALQGLTAIAEGVLGTAQLFGMSKENAEKLNATMTQLIGISQALATIEQLRAERTLQILALKARELTALAAEKVAVMAATAAQWAYNTSLLVVIGTIGAVVAVVAALTAGIYLLVKAHKEENAELEKQKTQYSTLRNELAKNINEEETALKIRKARGETGSALLKDELNLLQLQRDAANEEFLMLNKKSELDEKEKKRKQELINLWHQLGNEVKIKKAEIIKAAEDESKAEREEAKKATEEKLKLKQQEIDKEKQLQNEKLITKGTDYSGSKGRFNLVDDIFNKKETKKPTIPLEFEKLNTYQAALQQTAQTQQRVLNQGATGWQRFGNILKTVGDNSSYLHNNLAIVSESLSNFSQMFGEQTGAYKVFAVAQATINTFLAATQVLADKTVPTFLKPVLMGSIIGLGLAQVAKIAGAFQYGGIVPGSSYSGDRVPVMANSGEMILNMGQQQTLFSLLSGGGLGGEVRFEIDGTRLVGVLNNYNRKINSIR